MKVVIAILSCWILPSALTADGEFFGPTPYLSFNDSPFDKADFSFFFLEDFEDGLLNAPGVVASTGAPRGPGNVTDSVDLDDGVLDGLGQNGWDYTTPMGPTADEGILFSFDNFVLGNYPTHAGIVWTDGGFDSPTLFEAFDVEGNSLGTIGPVDISDDSFEGTTAEDRFFGVVCAQGISAILIRDPGSVNTLQVDHLQYGIQTLTVGDVNCDGIVDLLDVAPFVDLLINGGFESKADINQDGVVNLLDVAPFVNLLTGG